MENTTKTEITKKTEATQEISKMEVLKLLLDIMPNDEAESLLKIFTYTDIQRLFNEPKARKKLFYELNKQIASYGLLSRAINRIPTLVENKDKLLRDYAIEHYNELSRDNKRNFCIDMINQKDFQDDLYECLTIALSKENV